MVLLSLCRFLLISWLLDVSISDRRQLKSPTIIVEFIYYSLQFCHFLLHVFCCSVIRYKHIKDCGLFVRLIYYYVVLPDFTFTFHFDALDKEMATHSSVLAWRTPGTGEPGGLPSMGSHRVGHNWSDLAAAAAAAAAAVLWFYPW